jgi:LSD1 subclass zinc finger protein
LVMVLLILFVIFLICREINCWYFKINQRVGLLEDIRDLLKKNLQLQNGATSTGVRCPDCNAFNTPDTSFCTNCGHALGARPGAASFEVGA